jgi:hypothetical protein
MGSSPCDSPKPSSLTGIPLRSVLSCFVILVRLHRTREATRRKHGKPPYQVSLLPQPLFIERSNFLSPFWCGALEPTMVRFKMFKELIGADHRIHLK